ncbi:MAG: sigma-70 family RNA polymerase sigma factor [Candidatus Obscuribacterales bacterium]|nr:sigma-70 family RNA polymerase sigma factor [Candidatus Obscuribacterales bacterium]
MAKISPKMDISKSVDQDGLVRQYLPLVKQIAKRYAHVTGENVDDLTQVGSVGLLKAVKYYDANRENKASFKVFASVYIKGEIRHYLRDHGSLIQVPRKLNDVRTKISQLEEMLSRESERTPTVSELAARSGFTQDEVREARQSWENCHHYQSLESSDDNESPDEGRLLSELVADRKSLDELKYSEDREIISQALVSLGERTKQIVEFVYFYDLTQKEAANLLGVSEMGVSRAIRKAMLNLKEVLLSEIF